MHEGHPLKHMVTSFHVNKDAGKALYNLAMDAASVKNMASVRALLPVPSLLNLRSMKSFKLTVSTSLFCHTKPRTGSSLPTVTT
jgi:hypothetical protein